MTPISRRELLGGALAAGGAIAAASLAAPLLANETGNPPPPQDAPEPVPAPADQSGMLSIGLLQMIPAANDREANLRKADQFCRWAKERHSDIVLLPEMWSIGYTPFRGTGEQVIRDWQAQAVPRDGEWVGHFRKLARELDMAIAVTYLEQWDPAPRNTLTLVDRHGNDVLTYAKVHTCDFADFEACTTPGDAFHVVELDTAKGPVNVGAMICYDREFPEAARSLMLLGAEVVLCPNACLLDDLRIAQFQVRAHENSVCMAMTNYPAPYMNGRSVGFDVAGQENVQAGPDEGIYTALFDLASQRAYRRTTIWGDAFRRPHRYGLLTDSPKLPVFERTNAFDAPFTARER